MKKLNNIIPIACILLCIGTTPVMASEPKDLAITKSSPEDTYIDVDVTTQTLSYYEDGILMMQSDCVTGNNDGKHNTPLGTYQLQTHTPGKYLKGKTWNVWVDYWMRFTDDACGIHDATWRQNFGGDIYQTDGSHGCVNLPHEAASELFEMVDVGTTVIVHES